MVLAEDAFKYMNSGNEKTDVTQNPANQIYLTFPADSMFTEEDVHTYFRYMVNIQAYMQYKPFVLILCLNLFSS